MVLTGARRIVMAVGAIALATPLLWAQGRGGAPGPPPPAQATGTGVILGQVVDAATGQPVADATVTLGGRGGGAPIAPGRAGSPPAPPPSVVTGTDGRFVFHDLPAGRIQIDATAAGYLSSRVGQARPEGPARPMELADGERNGSVRIRMWKYGVLSGAVTDEAGEPAVGATVRAFRRPGVISPGTTLQSFTSRTDDRGAYRFSNLLPGDYLVVVPQTSSTFPVAMLERLSQAVLGGNPLASLDMIDAFTSDSAPAIAGIGNGGIRIDDLIWSSSFAGAPGPGADGRLISYPTLYYPGATTIAQATPIAVRSGEERAGIDIQLRLVPASRISGVVTGADGPVANVSVRLVTDEGELSSLIEVDVATAVTRADGTFLFLGVPPGRYRALATKRTAPNMAQMMAVLGGGKAPVQAPPRFARTPVTVGSADVGGVALTLREGATVSGRFEFQGASPRPQPGTVFNVQLIGTAGRLDPGSPPAPPEGDVPSRFKTAAYAPGLYRMTVAPGRGGPPGNVWTAATAMIDGHDALSESFELTSIDLTDVVIVFTDQVVRLNGTVRAASGPASTATVVVIPAEYPAWLAAGASPAKGRTMPADRTGAFTLAGLRPGDYLIAAVDDSEAGDLTDPVFIAAVAKLATPMTLAPGDNKRDLQVVKVSR